MSAFQTLTDNLARTSKRWLVTGVAGFIGSNLLEALLRLNQHVVGLDNYATGFCANLEDVRDNVGANLWKNFSMVDGDIRDLATCQRAADGIDYILHQAALGSVPRSIANPADSHAANVTGFLNILIAANASKVERIVYASSSSVYGDHEALPKSEDVVGKCLSPYAVTKRANELYADVFARCYGLPTIGLRYFNVFGPRQDPSGPYAAVIPKWIEAMIRNEPVHINGDGETSRDFCYVANVVQANLLAATVQKPEAINQVYNIAVSTGTTLNQLFELLRDQLLTDYPHLKNFRPVYRDFRPGDVRHSEASIAKADRLLGYQPSHTLRQGLAEAMDWYREHVVQDAVAAGPC